MLSNLASSISKGGKWKKVCLGVRRPGCIANELCDLGQSLEALRFQ